MAERVTVTRWNDLRPRYIWASDFFMPILDELDQIEWNWPEWHCLRYMACLPTMAAARAAS